MDPGFLFYDSELTEFFIKIMNTLKFQKMLSEKRENLGSRYLT
jgi:hypothetical protein